MEDKTIKNASNIVAEIKDKYADGVIKDFEICPLVNMKTGEDVGFCVIVYLANKYEYTNEIMDDWKNRLHADEYSVTARGNKLTFKFRVHYEDRKSVV